MPHVRFHLPFGLDGSVLRMGDSHIPLSRKSSFLSLSGPPPVALVVLLWLPPATFLMKSMMMVCVRLSGVCGGRDDEVRSLLMEKHKGFGLLWVFLVSLMPMMSLGRGSHAKAQATPINHAPLKYRGVALTHCTTCCRNLLLLAANSPCTSNSAQTSRVSPAG